MNICGNYFDKLSDGDVVASGAKNQYWEISEANFVHIFAKTCHMSYSHGVRLRHLVVKRVMI